MEPTNLWTWINQYAVPPYDQILLRAQAVRGVIIKWGMLEIRQLLRDAGIPWAVEAYIYPGQAILWGERLAHWYNDGAQFVVANAEVEWAAPGSGEAMEAFCLTLNAHSRRGRPPLYASVDTRGNRMTYPYQQILAEASQGWMPMIYPKAFEQTPEQAFVASLESGQNFQGLPVYPTIQTYDGIGPVAVQQQLAEVHKRALPGCQAYTLGHATPEEWEAFAMDWFDEIITGFGGQPVQYRVLVGGAPEYPTEWRSLTHRQWMQLQEWGLIIEEVITEWSAVPPHSHRGVVTIDS